MERKFRLRGESEVREARAKGKAYADGPLVARIVANEIEPPQNRYAVVAGKRVGNAVQRNRTKRLVREALRKLHPTLHQGHDIVVVVRGTTTDLTGLDVALTSLERIVKRAHLNERSAISRQPDEQSAVSHQPSANRETSQSAKHQSVAHFNDVNCDVPTSGAQVPKADG